MCIESQGGIQGAYLSENGVSVIGKDNAAHWVEEHLKHGLGSECGSHDVTHCLLSLGFSD